MRAASSVMAAIATADKQRHTYHDRLVDAVGRQDWYSAAIAADSLSRVFDRLAVLLREYADVTAAPPS